MLTQNFQRFRPVKLIHCIYASRALDTPNETGIQTLLERSRSNNAARGITGMLLFIEGSFFQVLEGDESIVDQTYQSILRDTRHDRVTRIIRETIPKRSFGEWSMGFESVDGADAGRLTGENDFFHGADCLQRITPGRAKKLLTAFGAGRWRTDQTGVHRAHARVG